MSLLARRDVLKSVLAWPLIGRLWPTAFAAPAPAIPADLPISLPAAEAYRKAFAWVETLTEADNALLGGGNRVPLGPAVDALLESARPALESVRVGASQRDCDWGIEIDAHVIEKTMPFPTRASGLVNALLLRSRRSADAGRWDEAVDDLFDILAYARHEGSLGLIICSLVQQAKEIVAIEQLACYLPCLPRPVLESLSGRFDRLPTRVTWREVMDAEYRYACSVFPEDYPELGLADRETFEANVRKLIAILDQPQGPSLRALQEWELESTGETPAGQLCASYQSSRGAWDRTETILAMLDAAIVRVRDGHEAFLAVRDPIDCGPFAIEPRGEGFVLRSAFGRVSGLKTELRVGCE